MARARRLTPQALADRVISLLSACSCGVQFGITTTSVNTAVWSTANQAQFYPFVLSVATTIKLLGWANGGVVSGNVDVGIYNAAGQRIVSTGSTAQAGTNAVQTVDIADVVLGPGLYFLAMVADNATGTYPYNAVAGGTRAALHGIMKMDAAFPLPATAAFEYFNQSVGFRAALAFQGALA